MNFSSIGDLAQNLLLRRQSASLQHTLSRLTSELVTGKHDDVAGSIRGDFGPLATIQRSLQVFDGYASARADTDLLLTGSQQALEGVQNIVGGLGQELLAATSLGQMTAVDARIDQAADRFENTVLLMNARVGDRYLFSGENATTPPLSGATAILDELRLVVAGAVTVTDFEQAIDDWFDLPLGGFETLGYQGGAKRDGAVRIGPSHDIRFELTASDGAFRDTLRNLGKLVLVSEGSFAGGAEARTDIAESAALGLIAANDDFTGERAAIGNSQALLAAAETQVEAERVALIEARSKLTDVDPFETASQLEAVQTQIETLYTITARNSRLNLMEYLR